MTERSSDIALVAGAHRSVRTLAEGEGPFEGELVTCASGVVVRVDSERLRGWAGWGFAGAEHVVAPVDIAVRTDGQDVLLPWCVRTVRTHLAQQVESAGIAHGEAVTLAVSVLRGVVELDGAARGDPPQAERTLAGEEEGVGDHAALRGSWWLTDEARPVFVIDAVDVDGTLGSPCETGERLLRDLEARIEDRTLRRLVARLSDALQDPRRLRAEAGRWEAELLENAAPRPLRMMVEGTALDAGEQGVHEQASPLTRPHVRLLRRQELRGSLPAGVGRPRELQHRYAEVLRWARDALHGTRERAGLLAGALRGAPDRRARPGEKASPGRKRWRGPVLAAVSVAAVVAVAGALWPTGGGGAGAVARPLASTPAGSADAPRRAAAAGAAAATEGTPQPSPGPGTSGSPSTPSPEGSEPAAPSDAARTPGASSQADPLLAGAELIADALSCQNASQASCAEIWDAGGSETRPLRAADTPAVLIEDYGDVAALRNGSDGAAQMIVIIRRDAEWRIRDVYDIANPPSEGTGAP